jgi:hypothetical protein
MAKTLTNATAAVSILRIAVPSDNNLAPPRMARVISLSVKPPSGPSRIVVIPEFPGCTAAARDIAWLEGWAIQMASPRAAAPVITS